MSKDKITLSRFDGVEHFWNNRHCIKGACGKNTYYTVFVKGVETFAYAAGYAYGRAHLAFGIALYIVGENIDKDWDEVFIINDNGDVIKRFK